MLILELLVHRLDWKSDTNSYVNIEKLIDAEHAYYDRRKEQFNNCMISTYVSKLQI